MATEIIYHKTASGTIIAEILPGTDSISSPDDILDLMAEVRYNGSGAMIIHERSLHPDFFDLKTRVAGDILQKFSNYRMQLAIIGDFSVYKSRSLSDFIRESNRTGTIYFAGTIDEALSKFNR